MRLAKASSVRLPWRADSLVQRMFKMFQVNICRILEYGIRHCDRLTSIDARIPRQREHTTFLIHTLGQVGNTETIRLLAPFVEDEYHGPDAVEAVRRLKSQQEFESLTVVHRFP
ncbi:MAG: hypothetical protein GY944_26560 [bacterium]|nr:hypothetical protein [bacterium]